MLIHGVVIWRVFSLVFVLWPALHQTQYNVCASFSGVADHQSGDLLSHEWIEVGFVDLDDTEWVSVTTKSRMLGQNNTPSLAIFLSLPAYGGEYMFG